MAKYAPGLQNLMQNTGGDGGVPARAQKREPIAYGDARQYAASLEPSSIDESGCYWVYCNCMPNQPIGCSRNCLVSENCLWTCCADFCCVTVISFAWTCLCLCTEHRPGNWLGKDDHGNEFRFVLVDQENGTWAHYGCGGSCCSPVTDTTTPGCWCQKM